MQAGFGGFLDQRTYLQFVDNFHSRTLPNCSISSSVSVTFGDFMFSSRCATDDVPGIGSIAGDRCSSQAIMT